MIEWIISFQIPSGSLLFMNLWFAVGIGIILKLITRSYPNVGDAYTGKTIISLFVLALLAIGLEWILGMQGSSWPIVFYRCLAARQGTCPNHDIQYSKHKKKNLNCPKLMSLWIVFSPYRSILKHMKSMLDLEKYHIYQWNNSLRSIL